MTKETILNDSEELISTTDLNGDITYANEAFCRVAEYDYEELVGQHHNIVRHPDMPKEAFKDLWEHLKNGETWRGAVKNKTKSGGYYWVDAFVSPIFENNQLVGYQSVRRKISDEQKQKASSLYESINKGKNINPWYKQDKFNHLFYFISAIIVSVGSFFFPYLSFLLIVLPFFFYKEYLVDAPKYFKELKKSYSSVSKLVYSGPKSFHHADFHIKMYEGKLNTIIGRITDSGKNLHDSSSELLSSSKVAKKGVEEETHELHQISTSIEQMTATISEVAENTAETSDKVKFAHDECHTARDIMDEAMDSIHQLSKEVEQSSIHSVELSEKAQKINEVMSEIQGIADQTNLLALNAAIEAARAGEHGRGFSVVADEVRALSSRTHNATEQIQDSISEIQSTLNEWSEKMKAGKETAENCISKSSISKNSIDSLYEHLSFISELSTQISVASEEQGAVSKEISNNIIKIKEASESNLSEAEKVEDISMSLLTNSDKLSSLGKSFNK